MTIDEAADILFECWHRVYGYAGEITFEAFRQTEIAKLVPDTSMFKEAGPYLDRTFVECVRECLRERGVKVYAFTPGRYRAYRKESKKWDELARFLFNGQV